MVQKFDKLRTATLASSSMYNDPCAPFWLEGKSNDIKAIRKLESINWSRKDYTDPKIGARWAVFSKHFQNEYYSNIYVISFRGSYTNKNWMNNIFKYFKIPWNENVDSGEIHKGCMEYLKAVTNHKETEKIIEDIKSDKKAFLLVTGHSLGGAIATIFGKWLFEKGFSKEKFEVIAVAPLAVGNIEFHDGYPSDNLTLLICANDPLKNIALKTGKLKFELRTGYYPGQSEKSRGTTYLGKSSPSPFFCYNPYTRLIVLPMLGKSYIEVLYKDFKMKKKNCLLNYEIRKKEIPLEISTFLEETDYYFNGVCKINGKGYYHKAIYYEAFTHFAVNNLPKFLSTEKWN